MALAHLTSQIAEKQKAASESRANVFDSRNVLARVESYDGNFLNVSTVHTGESFRVRLADASEFARSYVQDDKKTDEEKLGVAQKRIQNRPTVQDMNSQRKLVYMPVNGMVEIEQPRKIPNTDNDFYCSWIKGISNEPVIEAVIEGKISYIMRSERTPADKINTNIAPDQDVDRDRQYSIAVLQDKLTQVLHTKDISASPELVEQNIRTINMMMGDKLLEKDSLSADNSLRAVKDGGGVEVVCNGAQAMLGLELEDGKIYCTPLRHVMPDPSLEGNWIASPDGITGFLDNIRASNTKLSVNTPKDLSRTIGIAAVATMVGYKQQLPMADEQTQKVFDATMSEINSGNLKAVVTPQVWLRPLKVMKLAMTDLPIDDKGAGRQKAFTNQGYFDGKICLRTETTSGLRMTNANAKATFFDAQAPRGDYKPTGIISIMEQAIQEAYAKLEIPAQAISMEADAFNPDELNVSQAELDAMESRGQQNGMSGFDDFDDFDDMENDNGYGGPSGP